MGNIFWKFAWSVGYMWYRLETKFWLYRRTILYSFEIYGLFGTVYGIFGTVYMVYLVQYIWYIWYRLSSTALKYMVYLVQYISIFHIYGIFGTVDLYQYIWYRLSSTALKYMVYLVQYISIFGTDCLVQLWNIWYIWYSISVYFIYMVYLVQYISIFHVIRFNVTSGITGCMSPLQASSNGTSESRSLNGER